LFIKIKRSHVNLTTLPLGEFIICFFQLDNRHKWNSAPLGYSAQRSHVVYCRGGVNIKLITKQNNLTTCERIATLLFQTTVQTIYNEKHTNQVQHDLYLTTRPSRTDSERRSVPTVRRQTLLYCRPYQLISDR